MSGARHHTQLIVWQLTDLLRQATFTLTAHPVFTRDLKLHSQAEDAVNSACRNIAEGFGADTHREFARFVRMSRRSLNELQDAFHTAQMKGYVSARGPAASAATAAPHLSGHLAVPRLSRSHSR